MKQWQRKLIASILLPVLVISSGALINLDFSSTFTKSASAAQEFRHLIEAEDANMTGDIATSTNRAGYKGTGYATGFTQANNNSWSIKVNIPFAQHYTFTIRTASDNYKENNLIINGKQAATIVSEGDGLWHEASIDGIYLEAGLTTISVSEYWGWFDLDYILITDGSGIQESIYANATTQLVNPNSSQKSKDIMTYLKSIYGKHTLSGQSCTLNANTE